MSLRGKSLPLSINANLGVVSLGFLVAAYRLSLWYKLVWEKNDVHTPPSFFINQITSIVIIFLFQNYPMWTWEINKSYFFVECKDFIISRKRSHKLLKESVFTAQHQLFQRESSNSDKFRRLVLLLSIYL